MEQNPDVFNRTLALNSVGGDLEFLRDVVGIFQAASSTLIREIQDSLASRDLTAVEKKARLVKGAAQSIYAKRAYEAALALEAKARGGELTAAQEAAAKLEEEIKRLEPLIASLPMQRPPQS